MRSQHRHLRYLSALLAALALAACGTETSGLSQLTGVLNPLYGVDADTQAMYASTQDGDITVPAVPPQYLSDGKARQLVDYATAEATGTIIVDPYARRLYHVQGGGKAMRYAIAVGEAGYGFSGTARVADVRKWPGWTPTQNMLRQEPEKFQQYAGGLEGGLENPLGARALYLYRGGRDTFYRIHGTPSPWTIGHQASSGCIRMFNQDVMHLAERVRDGARVVVLTEAQSGADTAVDA